jgi:hypothetical protein
MKSKLLDLGKGWLNGLLRRIPLVILVIAVLFCLFVGIISITSEPSAERSIFQPSPPQYGWVDKFYIGAMCTEYDYSNHYSKLDSLGLSLWQQYAGGEYYPSVNRWYPKLYWQFPGITNDELMEPVENYSNKVNEAIDSIYKHNNRKLVMCRPKITWLCYGQRSDYKCSKDNIDTSLWFYSFQTHTTDPDERDDQYGNGEYVRHCRIQNSTNGGNWVDNPGIVVSRLRANTEQCRKDTVITHYENQWEGDSFCDWLIKPRIRVDSNFAHNNQLTPVCRIIVLNESRDTIKNSLLKGRNFLVDANLHYNGRYIEEYKYFPGDDTLVIHGDWATDNNGWTFTARGKWKENQEGNYKNKADIQIYWYGNCDMWLDYVRVDNDVASNLLSKDNNNPIHRTYTQWIKDEVEQIGLHIPPGATEPAVLKYYIELCEFNNLPCMHFVDSLLTQYSNGKLDLMQDLTPFIAAHVPWDNRTSILNANFLYRYYVQRVGFTQIFTESYPLNGCFVPTDNQTFIWYSGTLSPNNPDKLIAKPLTPLRYEDSLQRLLNFKPSYWEGGDVGAICGVIGQDPGQFRTTMQVCNSLSRMANIPFIFMPQVHQCFNQGEVHREPTNEELNMMTNVAVSYGVKGILFYWFPSYLALDGNYEIGMTEITNPNYGGPLRTVNSYGQGKDNPQQWKREVLKNIVDRLSNKWGPYLLSFDNTQTASYIYNFEDERNDLLSNSFLSDIQTYLPDPANFNNPINLAESFTSCYVQAATFKAENDNTNKYFMLVNRRCSPFYAPGTNQRFPNGENGGRRYIKVSFNSNNLQTSTTWSIINLENNTEIARFNTSGNPIVNLGWYMPGEGKLYKLEPIQ